MNGLDIMAFGFAFTVGVVLALLMIALATLGVLWIGAPLMYGRRRHRLGEAVDAPKKKAGR